MTSAESDRARIRRWRQRRRRRVAVLDDDPTGSQSVHDVDVVTALSEPEIAAALSAPSATAFLLTNTRALPEVRAVEITRAAVAAVLGVSHDVDIVSRSDSTLRGHVVAEIRAISEERAAATGRGFDGVVFAPALFEAGRFTAADTHYATIDGEPVPVGDTEFARDATFGYAASDLRDFIAERSGGTIVRDDVLSISLADIAAGPDRVRDVLLTARDGAFVVVNATAYEHYETVVLGLQDAIDAGHSFTYRTGPSFIRALTGAEPRPPLMAADLPQLPAGGHGLIVVGSHVSQTTRQIARARELGGLVEFELSVASILGGPPAYVDHAVAELRKALAERDVLLYTSRDLVRGVDPDESLRIAHTVSEAVSAVVAGVLVARPAWVIAKGGITSHDVAVHGLGMRRARVLGQMLPGLISVFAPVAAAPQAIGMSYVVFAGNVGDDHTLAHVISVLRGAQAGPAAAPSAALLIVADDLSGAAETAGAVTAVTGAVVDLRLARTAGDDSFVGVRAVDTDSRAMPPGEAGAVAAEAVGQAGPTVLVYKKVDSLLRGHIAAELAAIRRHRPRVVAVLAVPRIGRTVRGGVMHLGHTAIGSISAALGAPAVVVALDVVRSTHLRDAMHAALEDGAVAVLDAESDADLDAIAAVVTTMVPSPLVLGAGGFARSLAALLAVPPTAGRFAPGAARSVIVVGTRTASARRQVDRLVESGLRELVLHPGAPMALGDDDLVITLSPTADWDQLSLAAALREVGAALGALAGRVDLVLTGGDTARRVLDALGVTRLQVEVEIEDGAVLSTMDDGTAVVTRPGGFGDDRSLERILHQLRGSPSCTSRR